MGNQVEDTEPTMVEQLPITLEWHLNVHSTRNGRMQTPSSRTPMPRLLRIWCLHGWCLIQRRLAATPAATQALHTVAGTTRHSGSSSHLGTSPGWTAHEVSLRQPAHSKMTLWNKYILLLLKNKLSTPDRKGRLPSRQDSLSSSGVLKILLTRNQWSDLTSKVAKSQEKHITTGEGGGGEQENLICTPNDQFRRSLLVPGAPSSAPLSGGGVLRTLSLLTKGLSEGTGGESTWS